MCAHIFIIKKHSLNYTSSQAKGDDPSCFSIHSVSSIEWTVSINCERTEYFQYFDFFFQVADLHNAKSYDVKILI